MKVRARVLLAMALLALLPAPPAAIVASGLLDHGLSLSASAETDAALEAGVRALRDDLVRRQAELTQLAAACAARWPHGDLAGSALPQLAARSAQLLAPGDHARVRSADGATVVLIEGAPRDSAAASDAPGAPPRWVDAEWPLPEGAVLELRRALPETWTADAARLAAGLQTVRALRAERPRLVRGFLGPFLLIYGGALLLAVVLAWLVARGLTAPLDRLMRASERVAGGDWSVRVPAAGRDELAQLAQRFNTMLQTLDAQQRRLADLQAMAGWREMARALAHEVKNPLTPIQLTVEEMRERYRGDDPEYRALLAECSRIVVEEVDSLRRVVTRFREFSRPVEPRPEAVDLGRLLRDVAALQADLPTQVEVAADLGSVEADADLLRQLLMNLAENARHALAGRASPRVWLRARRVAETAVVEFEDNGPGIPAADRQRVFEPYHSGRAGGLGLGLALVKGIVLAHGGAIEVGEGAQGGARFVLQLPMRQVTRGGPRPLDGTSSGATPGDTTGERKAGS